jgi:hypothetical protein
LRNDLLGVLPGEGLKLLVSIESLLNGWNLLAGNVAGDVFAIFPRLELIEGTGSALLDDGELAAFHGLNLSDLLKETGPWFE